MTRTMAIALGLALLTAACGGGGADQAEEAARLAAAPTATPTMTTAPATPEMMARAKPPGERATLMREIVQCVRASYGPRGPAPERMAEVGQRIRELSAKGQAGLEECRAS